MALTGPWTPQNKPMKGTQVIVNPETFPGKWRGIWEVVAVLQKNVEVRPSGQPTGKKLRISPEYLVHASPENIELDKKSQPGGYTVTHTADSASLVPNYPTLHQGTVVKVAGPGWKGDPDQLYVIHTDNTFKNNSVRLSYLGGKSSYWPKIPRAWITVVSLADILK